MLNKLFKKIRSKGRQIISLNGTPTCLGTALAAALRNTKLSRMFSHNFNFVMNAPSLTLTMETVSFSKLLVST
jgi:hypothetical protein